MECLFSKFRNRELEKDGTLEELQTILLRVQSPPKKFQLSTGDYNEVFSKVYVGDW